jgi:hypothetical protein
MSVIEIDLFPEDIDSLDHPYVEQFRELLEEAADAHNCRLLSFDIDQGTVSFSFDSDEMTAEIIMMLKDREADTPS